MQIKKIIFSILLFFAGTYLVNSALIYSQNILLLNSSWYSHKQNFFNSYAGAIESLTSRGSLASYRFISNQNYGSQLFFSTTQTKLKEITFKFRLKDYGYLDFIYNFDGKTYDAIRMSRFEPYPNIYYHGEISGEFVTKKWLDTPNLNGSYYELKIIEENGQTNIYLDNKIIGTFNTPFIESRFGFLSSMTDSEILSVNAIDQHSNRIPTSFALDQIPPNLFFKNLAIISMIFILTLPIALFLYKQNFVNYFYRFALFVTLSALTWFSFDLLYYSKIPRKWHFVTFTYVFSEKTTIDLEMWRSLFFKKWFVELGGENLGGHTLQEKGIQFHAPLGYRMCSSKNGCSFVDFNDIVLDKPANTKRFAFIGGSFSEHAGVVSIEDSFFDKFSHEIMSNLKSKNIQSEFYNFSDAGRQFDQLIGEFGNKIVDMKADYLVINCFVIETSYQSFQNYVHYLKSLGITPIYISPAPNIEHFYVLSHGKDTKVFVTPIERMIDDLSSQGLMFNYKANRLTFDPEFYGKGIAWWDPNHMTAYGQKAYAHKAALAINSILNTRK